MIDDADAMRDDAEPTSDDAPPAVDEMPRGAFGPLLASERKRVVGPVLVALGAPRLATAMAKQLELPDTACYQMDLFAAQRLREELTASGITAEVLTAPDLWDLPPRFQTVLLPSPPRGERELKRDLVEQGFHALLPGGRMVVLSPVEKDDFYPALLKKVFGKAALSTSDDGTVIWATRTRDRPRRRHELSVRARLGDGMTLEVLTRPGVFAYGRLDHGARALAEVMDIQAGDRILEIGCGSGAVGVAAARRSGPGGAVTLVDSNLRAVELAKLNAERAGVTAVCLGAVRLEGVEGPFDVVLANPPYYAQAAIARLFVERARDLLKVGGRLYLVTKQWEQVEPIVDEAFGEPDLIDHRGYIVLVAKKRKKKL